MTNDTIDNLAEIAETLPFGDIHIEDMHDNPENPLIYAEAQISDDFKLWWSNPDWNGWTKSVSKYTLIVSASRINAITELLDKSEQHSGVAKIPISQERAEKILKEECDNTWTYAE